MPATDTSGVKIVINVVDANSGEVISRTVKNLDAIGAAGAKAGKQVADGMATASAAITKTDADAEKGSAAFAQRVKRMSAEHDQLVGKISRGQQQIQQAMNKGFSGSSGFGGSSFTNGLVNDLKKFEAAGDSATKKVSSGFKEMGGHALTSLDNVRLLRDDLGVRIPRSMEKAIASSKLLSTVVNGLGGALLAFGTLELFLNVTKEAYEFYQKLTDINAEVRKYEEGAARASAQKLFAAGDIETQIANLRLLNTEVGKLQSLQTNAAKRGIVGQTQQLMNQRSGSAQALDYTGVGYLAQYAYSMYKANQGNNDRDANLAQDLQSRDGANEKIFSDRQAAQMERLKNTLGAQAKGLGEVAAAAQKEQADRLIAALAMRQTRNLDLFHQQQYDQQAGTIRTTLGQQGKSQQDIQTEIAKLGPRPQVDPNAGQQQFDDTTFAAQESASGQRREIAKKEADEIADSQAKTREAGLQGEARYRQQLSNEIDAFERKVRAGDMTTTTAHKLELDARARYDKEYQERRKVEQQETARIQQEAAGAGMTGLAKLDNERATRLAELEKQKATFSDPGTYGQRKSAIGTSSDADATKLQGDFTDRIKQMDDARANSSMSANARILADTRRTIDELQKAFDALYGGLGAADPRRAQGQQALDAEKGRISASAAQEIARNNQQLADDTAKLQDEAMRGGGGNRYAEQYRAVESELADHLRKLTELKQQAGANDLQAQQQYAAQEQAYRQIAYNKELDLAREQRDKLAGELKGYLTNPLEALKRQGEDIASKAAADLLMGHLPGSPASPGNKSGGLFDGGVNSIFRPFHKGSGNAPGAPVGGAHRDIAAIAQQQATVNATTATINVGSASFSGAPGAGNSAGTPSGTVRGIANGGYVSTGNGGFFNVGGVAGTNAAGGSDSMSGGEAGSPAYSANMPASAGSFGGAPAISTDSSMGGESPSQALSRAYGGAQQVSSMGKDLGVFGKDASGNNAGITSKIPGLKDMDSKQLGQLSGTAAGALGVFSAFEGKGGVGGAFSGALSGAEMGAQYGGPIGAAIGAIGGAVLGFIGHGARVQAQQYYFKELLPKLQQDMLGFESGSTDYQSAYDDLTSMETSAKQRTKQMGPGAEDYYNDTIKPRIDGYMQRLTREQKAGRSQFGMSAAQFHSGGPIGGFGSMATSSTEGWLHAERGEFMLNQQAAMSHADVASMMNAGVSRSDIADYMGGGSGPQRTAADAPDMHFHLHTLDTKTAQQWLVDQRHTIRGAMNLSYAENSGGAD